MFSLYSSRSAHSREMTTLFHQLIVCQLRNCRLIGIASNGLVKNASDFLTSSQSAVENLVEVFEIEFLGEFNE